MKTDLFQSCGHCWVFQICWHIECGTFTASSFRIWKSSTGIPSPPLDLFVVMLSKAHLTSHSRMSGSRWVITPSWLSGSWRSFLLNLWIYANILFLILFKSSMIPACSSYYCGLCLMVIFYFHPFPFIYEILLDETTTHLPWCLSGKNPTYQCRRHGLDHLIQEDPMCLGATSPCTAIEPGL